MQLAKGHLILPFYKKWEMSVQTSTGPICWWYKQHQKWAPRLWYFYTEIYVTYNSLAVWFFIWISTRDHSDRCYVRYTFSACLILLCMETSCHGHTISMAEIQILKITLYSRHLGHLKNIAFIKWEWMYVIYNAFILMQILEHWPWWHHKASTRLFLDIYWSDTF